MSPQVIPQVIPQVSPQVGAVRRAATGLRWYVRQLTGEGKWDEYVAACAATGERPMSRREFERRRDHEREHAPGARCC